MIYDSNNLSLSESYINIADVFKTKISAQYEFDKKQGSLQTRRLRVSDLNNTLFFHKEPLQWEIGTNENSVYLYSKDMHLKSYINAQRWKINVSSLDDISKNSPLLKKYHFTDGRVHLKSFMNEKIDIEAQVNYPYKLMVNNNMELSNYRISGEYDLNTNKSVFTINDKIKINIGDKVTAKADNVGFNVSAVKELLDTITKKKKEEKSLDVQLITEKSYLYLSKDRRIITDSMYMNYKNGVLVSGFTHGKGFASINVIDNKIYAYGDKFNDKFMEKLFYLSKFKGGNFGFKIAGDLDSYDGVFKVNNTIILDYKILNNVLSFVNTIPSLVTFSTPGYSSQGLKLKNAYMKFKSLDDKFQISDIYFNSKELDILGRGEVSLEQNNIDLELNLKTAIGDQVSQIPVLGHVLMDDDSVSTTLSINGALDNPKVKSLIAKEIVVAPLNIVLRAITLPYYLMSNDSNTTPKRK